MIHVCLLGRLPLFETPWTRQALWSMEVSRQECWNGLPFPSPRTLCNPGIEPVSHVSPALAGRYFTTEPPGKPQFTNYICFFITKDVYIF